MKVTILGCGSSGGVPLIGGDWGACDPANPRNRRSRVSILVEDHDNVILVDTSPDMRQQLLDAKVKKIDAVLYTHTHADHCHGIDELRSVNWLTKKPVDVYADAETLRTLAERFAYIFQTNKPGSFYKPAVAAHEISGPFTAAAMNIIPFHQNHGVIHSMGYRFGDFAYSTDVHDFDENAIAALRGIKTWVLDCVREEPHPTHMNLEKALKWIKKIAPERAFLTHMNHQMDYGTLKQKLPAGVEPAYDGLVIKC